VIEENNVDFGSIQIHKEALADIVFSAISEIEGVSLVPKSVKDRFLEFLGKKRYSGIKVAIDNDKQITIEVKIFVRYGMNISTIGRQVQESIRSAIDKTAEVSLKDVNVNVCGMERGNP